MKMTIRNKIILGMDKLIEDAKCKTAIPNNIELSFGEAVQLVLEIAENPKDISIQHENNLDVRFLIKKSTTKEQAEIIVTRWKKNEFMLQYKKINLLVIVPKISFSAKPRENEDSNYSCKLCGGELHKKWIFFNDVHCIQAKCENYWKKF